jgi:capsular polysaccharide export protein
VPVHASGRVEEGPDTQTRAATGLVTNTSYVDPFTGKACTAEDAVDLVSLWQNTCAANRHVAACVGVQFWKRRRVAQFLHTGTRPPRFSRPEAALAHASATGGAVAAWASRIPPDLTQAAARASVPLHRIEDGFVRSVGLGSDFNVPCSIVIDAAGLYYDPRQPSDLETLLATHEIPPAMRARARNVIDRLVAAGTTKYGTGDGSMPPLPQDGRRRILVPGQVADDLSVRLGAGAATGNADLLEKVRAENPDAFIVYKPHPDVEAGHRSGALDDAKVLRHADVVARGGAMAPLIGAVDEVHTMTSLAGFEALLRGRRVVVYGRPFYAGWGLTDDRAPIPRRGRTLCLEALTAGVLLLYPRYIDPVTALPCPVEVLLDRMADPSLWRAGPLVRLRRLQGQTLMRLRKIIRPRAKRTAV